MDSLEGLIRCCYEYYNLRPCSLTMMRALLGLQERADGRDEIPHPRLKTPSAYPIQTAPAGNVAGVKGLERLHQSRARRFGLGRQDLLGQSLEALLRGNITVGVVHRRRCQGSDPHDQLVCVCVRVLVRNFTVLSHTANNKQVKTYFR